jgi:DNA-binding response OmpR family regulator
VQSTSLAGRTILVVEDEPLITMDISTAFENVGAVVVTAPTLGRADRLVEHDCLSAAVMDLGLPDGDADAMCVRLEE